MMPVDNESTVNIYPNTVYHTLTNTLKDIPGLTVFDTDDINFATNSTIQITNDRVYNNSQNI